MGSAQSSSPKYLPTQKDSGTFNLTEEQTNTIQIMLDAFQQLIGDNNILSLDKILKDPDFCKNIYMVLSTTLEDDFRTLRFPDPLNPNDTVLVSYMVKPDYDNLATQPSRKILCGSLVFFMIRLITMVGALVSSLKYNKDILHNLDLIRTESLGVYNRKYRSPIFEEEQRRMIKARNKIDAAIVKILLDEGSLIHVKLEDHTTPDKRPIYYFRGTENNPNRIVMDIEKSIIYYSRYSEKQTPVFGVKLREIEYDQIDGLRSRSNNEEDDEYYRRLKKKKQTPRPLTVRNYVSDRYKDKEENDTGRERERERKFDVSSIENRHFRKTRKHTHRNQSGGARFVFLMTIQYMLQKDKKADAIYIMEDNGMTYTIDEYTKMKRGTIIAPLDTMLVGERLQKLLDSELSTRVPLKEMKESDTIRKRYSPLVITDGTDKLLAILQNIFETLNKKPEGTSPSFYRGFLLASRQDREVLQTLFCQDQWASRKVTSQLTYSLLHSLYCTRQDGTIDSETQLEYSQMITTALPYYENVSDMRSGLSLEQLAFKTVPYDLNGICERYQKGAQPITEQKDMIILQEAHRNLHYLFEKHLTDCANILMEVVIFGSTDGYSKPSIRLNKRFYENRYGALDELEKYIKLSRTVLFNHCIQTERIYQEALDKITRISRGEYTTKMTNDNILHSAFKNTQTNA